MGLGLGLGALSRPSGEGMGLGLGLGLDLGARVQAITRTGHTSAWSKESLRPQGEVASISAKW